MGQFSRMQVMVIVASVGALVIGGGVAAASIPAAPTAISACYQKRGGALRLIVPGHRGLAGACRKTERLQVWNRQGPHELVEGLHVGAPGVAGPQGTPGIPGTPGAAGPRGAPGVAGPLLTQLPSGRSETGVYDVVFYVVSTSGGRGGTTAISFPIPLATAPTANLLEAGQPSTAACPGSVSDPTAAPGELCIYEGVEYNVSGFEETDTEDDGPGANRFGMGLFVEPGSTLDENGYSEGTWAVTAP